MKGLAHGLLLASLAGCSKDDGVSDVSAMQGSGQQGKQDRSARADGADAGAPDVSGTDGPGDDDAPNEDASGDDDAIAAMDDAPGPTTENEPDMVVFGGNGTPVVVEPEPGASVPASDDPDPDPDPDEPASEEEPAEDPLVSCAGVAGAGDGVLIDDMEDGDLESLAQDERSGSWFSYDDGSGGSHSLLMESVTNGPSGGTRAARIVDGGFSEWGSGVGVGMRWDDGSGSRCVYDASYYTGLHLWLRGNGAPVRIIAINPAIIPASEGGACVDEDTCWDNHGYSLETSEDWTEVFVPFSELLQRWTEPPLPFDPTQIFSIEFTLDAYVDYDIWIDDLGFYREGEDLPAYGASLLTAE